jgi:hypothetical protein
MALYQRVFRFWSELKDLQDIRIVPPCAILVSIFLLPPTSRHKVSKDGLQPLYNPVSPREGILHSED